MLRVVFFDAAGTLFEPAEPIAQSYARIAERFGVRAEANAIAAAFHRAFSTAPALAFGPGRPAIELRRLERDWWRRVVARVFEGLGEFRDFDAYFDALFSFFADPANWRVDPEACEVLGRLKKSGIALGVISNFDHRLYGILDGLGLKAAFDSITISSEAGFAKPSPEVFRTALRKHSAQSAEAMHVGDSEPLDIGGAAAAGIAAVLLDRDCHGIVTISEQIAKAGSLAYLFEVAQGLRLA
jgi:putative hydrolase of the HAD superfamily